MKLMRRLRRFGAAKKGLAALEFAIIAPMMIFLLFGSVDLIDMLGVDRRTQNVAASLADIVARDDAVSNQEVQGLWDALDVLMFPDDGTTMEVRVTSISVLSATNARVVWSEGHGMTPRTANSSVTLPAGMMTVGTSIIMTEANYRYNSPLGFLVTNQVTMSHSAYRRSRLVDPIPRVS